MKKNFLPIIVFLAGALCLSLSAFGQEAGYERFLGEVISYDVRSLAMKMADAHTELKGLVDLDGRKVYLIVFEATGSNFFDKEKIYADPEGLYPLRVERDVTYLGSVEKIVEVYDQEKFTVTITKTTRAKPEPELSTIQKKGKIDNIYCFIYRYRLTGDFQIGSSLNLNLPTKDVSVKVVKNVTLNAAGKQFNTVFLETLPSQYRIWFDTRKRKVPLRIDKPAMVGGTIMVINNYSYQGAPNDTAQ